MHAIHKTHRLQLTGKIISQTNSTNRLGGCGSGLLVGKIFCTPPPGGSSAEVLQVLSLKTSQSFNPGQDTRAERQTTTEQADAKARRSETHGHNGHTAGDVPPTSRRTRRHANLSLGSPEAQAVIGYTYM